WNSTSSKVELAAANGATLSVSATLTIPNAFTMSCAADFDSDGKADIAGADSILGTIMVLKNTTVLDTVALFGVQSYLVELGLGSRPGTATGIGGIACGDVNGDGFNDIVIVRCSSGSSCTSPGRADLFLGKGDGTFQTKTQIVNPLT